MKYVITNTLQKYWTGFAWGPLLTNAERFKTQGEADRRMRQLQLPPFPKPFIIEVRK
jgi:hypothetical protein